MKKYNTIKPNIFEYKDEVTLLAQKILEKTKSMRTAIKSDDYILVDNCLNDRFELLNSLLILYSKTKEPFFCIEFKNIFQEIMNLDYINNEFLKMKKEEIAALLVGLYHSKGINNYLK